LDLQETLTEQLVKQQVTALRERAQNAVDIMTHPVITLRESDTVHDAVEQMVKQGLKRLPVVNDQKELVGWISRVDVLRSLEYHHLPSKPASESQRGKTLKELMYRNVPTVTAEAKLEEILQALEEGSYRRVVVIDEARRVIGIITDGDLLRRSQRGEHPGLIARLRSLIIGKPVPAHLPESDERAADLMSTPVITIIEDTSLIEAMNLMLRHQIKRLPVLNKKGELVGLLGRGSLLQGLL
jgi:CBS domain-containing protein